MNFKKIIVSSFIFLLVLESLLRYTGIFQTYHESINSEYYSYYGQSKPSWFHALPPNVTYTSSNSEFKYINKYNDLGHRELDFSSFLLDTLSEKIICLGDSFTEGDGAPADSTWVKRLGLRLNEKYGFEKYRLYNAGVCGSDVFFNNRMLVNKMMVLNPKIVIECVNSSDIYDVITRGGAERFATNGTTIGKAGPIWEPLYKYSHIFRVYMMIIGGYDQYLVKGSEYKKTEKKVLISIKKQVELTANFCKENNIKYVLVIHPVPYETNNQLGENVINAAFVNTPYVLNLFSPMFEFYEKNNIEKYSWKINNHYNSKGYEIMGDLIFDELSQKELIE